MADTEATTTFNDNEVMMPSFRLEANAPEDEECRRLFMQTFVTSPANPSTWVSTPRNTWPLIATFHADRIELFPIHANPHAQRYLKPQHGRFQTVEYVDNGNSTLPADVDAALNDLMYRLPSRLFNSEDGRGVALHKEVDEVWRTLAVSVRSAAPKLVIAKDDKTRLDEDSVIVNEADLEDLRRSLNRIERTKREGIRMAKRRQVFLDLLTKLNPEHFVTSTTMVPIEMLAYAAASGRRTPRQREATRAAMSSLKSSLPELAADTPEVLLELRAEIERVTLAQMISKFEELFSKDLPEGRWQQFFELNKFVLGLLFARPVTLLHTQFHAHTSGIGGAGAQVGDFLFGELGQGLAIVEIKKPATELMLSRPYRNTQVFAPTAELTGAITQTLHQQSAIRSNWLQHRVDPKLSNSRSDAIKCYVIAGKYPTAAAARASFELFRNACKDVEVVTFDELLAKLQQFLVHLTPPTPDNEPPF